MGEIRSVSLPSGTTCGPWPCRSKCYARKLERMRKNVRKAYQNNLTVLRREPEVYWREVEAAIMLSRFFRFHVSGDIPDEDYLKRMVEVAERNPHCQILCFTKRYSFVNDLLSAGGALPKNLRMIFSAWAGLPMENPFHLPEAHVRYRDGTTTAGPDAKLCAGNCAACAATEGGCWTLGSGGQVVFDEH